MIKSCLPVNCAVNKAVALSSPWQLDSVLMRAESLPGQCRLGAGGTSVLSVVLTWAGRSVCTPGCPPWKGCCLQLLAPSQSPGAWRSRVGWVGCFGGFFLSLSLISVSFYWGVQGEEQADSYIAWGRGEREKKGCEGLTCCSASIYSFPTISNLSHLTMLGT